MPCCCSDSRDGHQLTFAGAPTTDVAGGARVGAEQAGMRPYSMTQLSQGTPFSPHATDPGSSTRSLTDEEKAAEKSRLQGLVNTFAKRAVRGCPCTLVRETSGEKASTLYKIDRNLGNLIIVSAKDRRQQEVSCRIAAIQDMYCWAEDGESCFPAEVVDALSVAEKELLLMVVYRQDDKLFRFSLVESSKESRDMFLDASACSASTPSLRRARLDMQQLIKGHGRAHPPQSMDAGSWEMPRARAITHRLPRPLLGPMGPLAHT
eukprot:CAMPEP_0176243628 /NCGR_PEP_ID=MMETSP0121_2-20121125/31021_1 /TAXON_ID=160619 /ORGANISM="Kryptoperidinium foliaceum, Strain CCMP 1326" /LENGTH=262 /DNA_ID=CAMNT_0017583225 /DNA_START=1 /DNA_END=786 /DNA_ORIENTATION=+